MSPHGPEPPDPPQPLDHRLFFSGTTLQQAVLAAARHFGIDPDVVAYRRRDKTSGFVKGPRVVIEVDPAAPRHRSIGPPGHGNSAAQPTSAAPPPPRRHSAELPPRGQPAHAPERRDRRDRSDRGDRPPRPEGQRTARPARADRPGDARAGGRRRRSRSRPAEGQRPAGDAIEPQRSPQEVAEGLQEAARRLFALGGLDLTVELQREGSGWRVLVRGADEGRVAGDPDLRSGLEHLLPRVLRGLIGTAAGARVVVGGRDAQREAELQEMARQCAERVLASGEAVTLPEMNSFERRIVHVALAETPGIATESEGEGASRRVVVRRAP
jgi:spoIIIJ-associated protein